MADYDYDFPRYDADQRVIHGAVFGVGLSLGILTSFVLMVWLLVLSWRLRKSSAFYFVLTSWSFATFFYLVVSAASEFHKTESGWSAGEFACRALTYLGSSLAYTRAYLMVLTAIFIAVGNRRFRKMTKTRPWSRIAVPVAACSLIWFMILLPCMAYWHEPSYISVGSTRKAYWCISDRGGLSSFVLELVFQFVLPCLLTAGFLVAWGCRQKSKMAERVERVERVHCLVLLVVLHVCLIFEVFVLGVLPMLLENSGILPYAKLCDYTLSPAFSLAIMFYFRGLFVGAEGSSPNENDADVKREI